MCIWRVSLTTRHGHEVSWSRGPLDTTSAFNTLKISLGSPHCTHTAFFQRVPSVRNAFPFLFLPISLFKSCRHY